MKVFVLLYPARGFGGALIRWQTRSKYSHAAVAFSAISGDEPITLFESIQGKGVLKRTIGEEDDRADWFEVGADYTAGDLASAYIWAQSQVGKKYDWTMVIRFVTRKQESRKSKGQWFCSEYAFVILTKLLERSGIVPLARTEPWEVSPGLLSRCPVLRSRQ